MPGDPGVNRTPWDAVAARTSNADSAVSTAGRAIAGAERYPTKHRSE